jgi:hypothetical protein
MPARKRCKGRKYVEGEAAAHLPVSQRSRQGAIRWRLVDRSCWCMLMMPRTRCRSAAVSTGAASVGECAAECRQAARQEVELQSRKRPRADDVAEWAPDDDGNDDDGKFRRNEYVECWECDTLCQVPDDDGITLLCCTECRSQFDTGHCSREDEAFNDRGRTYHLRHISIIIGNLD